MEKLQQTINDLIVTRLSSITHADLDAASSIINIGKELSGTIMQAMYMHRANTTLESINTRFNAQLIDAVLKPAVVGEKKANELFNKTVIAPLLATYGVSERGNLKAAADRMRDYDSPATLQGWELSHSVLSDYRKRYTDFINSLTEHTPPGIVLGDAVRKFNGKGLSAEDDKEVTEDDVATGLYNILHRGNITGQSIPKTPERTNCPDTVIHVDEDGVQYKYSLGAALHLLLQHLFTRATMWEYIPLEDKYGYNTLLKKFNLLK